MSWKQSDDHALKSGEMRIKGWSEKRCWRSALLVVNRRHSTAKKRDSELVITHDRWILQCRSEKTMLVESGSLRNSEWNLIESREEIRTCPLIARLMQVNKCIPIIQTAPHTNLLYHWATGFVSQRRIPRAGSHYKYANGFLSRDLQIST